MLYEFVDKLDKSKVANAFANILIAYGTVVFAYNAAQLIKNIKK